MVVIEEKIDESFIPITGSAFSESYGRFYIFVQFWLIGILLYFVNVPYFNVCKDIPWLYIILPLWLYGFFYQITGLSILISAIYIRILWLFHPIKEGIFDLDSAEFRWYCRRYWAVFLPIYFSRAMPLPWMDMVVFRIFKVKTGANACLYDGWLDTELLEIGDSVMLSLNASIMSHYIYQNKFIIKKVVIEKNSIIGADSVVSPGTFVEEGAIIGTVSSTKIDQRLEGYLTHVGNPVYRKLPIKVQETQVLKVHDEYKKQEKNKTGGDS
jgi:hypothetical protein